MKLNFYDQTDWLSIGMCHDQTSYSLMFFLPKWEYITSHKDCRTKAEKRQRFLDK